MPEYFIILIIFLCIGAFLHIRYHVKLYKTSKQMILTNIAFFVVAVLWDQFAIWRGHWSFGRQYLLGPHVGFMPIEEYGFTFILTYFVLVLYRLFEKRFH